MTEPFDFERELVALIPHMRAFARGLCGDTILADDLAQDALLRAWRRQETFKPGTNMRGWVFMIVRNQFFSLKRRAWRSVELAPKSPHRPWSARRPRTTSWSLTMYEGLWRVCRIINGRRSSWWGRGSCPTKRSPNSPACTSARSKAEFVVLGKLLRRCCRIAPLLAQPMGWNRPSTQL